MTTNVMNPKLQHVIENIEKVMIGKRTVAELSLVAMLANGHVLLEDVPEIGRASCRERVSTSV